MSILNISTNVIQASVVLLLVNAQSCANFKTFDDFKLFISKFKSNIDVIVVIKINETSIYNIEGYRAIHSCRHNRRGGGLSIFIKHELNIDETEISEIEVNVISYQC